MQSIRRKAKRHNDNVDKANEDANNAINAITKPLIVAYSKSGKKVLIPNPKDIKKK